MISPSSVPLYSFGGASWGSISALQRKQKKMMVNRTLIIGVVLLLLFVIYSYTYWNSSVFHSQNFYQYAATLFHLGVIVTLIGFFSEGYFREEAQRASQHLSMLNSTQEFTKIHTQFLRNKKDLWPLYQEMYQSNSVLQDLPKAQVTPENLPEIFAFAKLIFYHIDETVTTVTFLQVPIPREYILRYREWFQSSLLRRIWDSQSNLYNPDTREFLQREIFGSS
jgi:cytochrome c biogenesis factor